MPSSGRALGILGWLVAATVIAIYVMARYDITIQKQGPPTRVATLAVAAVPGEWKPVVDERYTNLAAEAENAAGADLPEVDRKLEAAERAFPSDYRFTYERATLAVYGRAEHHEAFYHLRRAAEKAIETERTREMLSRLEQDGRLNGRLRRLAVGHDEWSVLREALEGRDRDRLWHAHKGHLDVPTATRKRVPSGQSADHASSTSVSSRLEHETPCLDALAALRQVPIDREAKSTYHRLRELCLQGSGPAQPPVSVPGPRHH